MLEYVYASVLNANLYIMHMILTNLTVNDQIKEVVSCIGLNVEFDHQASIKGQSVLSIKLLSHQKESL